jgi:GNAT superfamily N-acetyltransferase
MNKTAMRSISRWTGSLCLVIGTITFGSAFGQDPRPSREDTLKFIVDHMSANSPQQYNLDLLCARNCKPVEIGGARSWAHDRPELRGALLEFGAMTSARAQSPCFLGEVDGQPGVAGALCIHEGVALFAGASTVPELRRRGLQGALLEKRMRYASDRGCDLAMMVAEAGSESQRNAERRGSSGGARDSL